MNTREVLEQGLERIKKGWTQDWYTDATKTKVCAAGALFTEEQRQAEAWFGDDEHLLPVMSALAAALPPGFDRHERCGVTCVPAYNDTPGRTVDEIIELYKKAIVDSPLEEK